MDNKNLESFFQKNIPDLPPENPYLEKRILNSLKEKQTINWFIKGLIPAALALAFVLGWPKPSTPSLEDQEVYFTSVFSGITTESELSDWEVFSEDLSVIPDN